MRAKKPRVLFLAYTQPLYVAGNQTFTGDIIELTGAENAAKTTGWPQYSAEALIKRKDLAGARQELESSTATSEKLGAPAIRAKFRGNSPL